MSLTRGCEVGVPLTNQADATLLRLRGAAGAVLLHQLLDARTFRILTQEAVAQHSKLLDCYVTHADLEHSIHQPIDIVFERVARPDDEEGARKLSEHIIARKERGAQVLTLLHVFVVEHSFWGVAADRQVQELGRQNVVVER